MYLYIFHISTAPLIYCVNWREPGEVLVVSPAYSLTYLHAVKHFSHHQKKLQGASPLIKNMGIEIL